MGKSAAAKFAISKGIVYIQTKRGKWDLALLAKTFAITLSCVTEWEKEKVSWIKSKT